MAKGFKSGGGSRKGCANERTVAARGIAMSYVAEAVLTLATLIPGSPDELSARIAAVQLLNRAVAKVRRHRSSGKRTHAPGEGRGSES
jgi:hypothetical protein